MDSIVSGSPRLDGAEVVRLARGWIGTPYHHQASHRGVGTDCLGLVRGVFRDLYGIEPEALQPYTRDWSVSGTETLLAAAARNLETRWNLPPRAGDIVVFRYRARFAAKHCGIVASETAFIHAIEGAAVSEVALTDWWRRRLAGVFCFPGVMN